MRFLISASCLLITSLAVVSNGEAQEVFPGSVAAGTVVSGVQDTEEKNPRVSAKLNAETDAELAADEKLLLDAEALLKNGQPGEAYDLLEPFDFERSGEVRFDYLLGISALDSGKPDKATLAFERVLAVDPGFAGARLDMARAYYQLGDMPRAKIEFETVLKLDPPEAARQTIQEYLDAIAGREEVKQTYLSGYVEGTIGYDNNINVSTSQSQININNVLFTLNPSNIKTADSYLGGAVGGEINHTISPALAVYAGVDVRDRNNLSQSTYNSISVDGHAGLAFSSGAELFRVGILGGQYTLANIRNRNTTGVTAEWRHTYSPANQLAMFVQSSRYRFVDPAMKTNDFDQNVLGAGWLHVLENGKSALFGSLYLGTENDVAVGGRVDGAKRFSGLRIGGQRSFNDRMEWFASIGGQFGDYTKSNVVFSRQRSDRQYDLSLGANWHRDELWSIRPQLSFSRNDSNIAIYGYDRTDISLTIRRDFK